MTRKRILHCDNPNCPHEKQKKMSDWIRDNLPDSNTGYYVSDLDFILENWKTKNIIFLEIKTSKAEQKLAQKILFENIDKWIKKGISEDWTYHGFHVIQFETHDPEDGKVFYDGKEITKKQLLKILQFEEA